MKSFHYPPTIFVTRPGSDGVFIITTKPVHVFLSKDQDPADYRKLEKNQWFFMCDAYPNDKTFLVSDGENGFTKHDFDRLTSIFLFYSNKPWCIKGPLSMLWTCL